MTDISEEYRKIAEKVRTGEYYREARNMYDFSVHDPMSERYLYVAITSLALMIFSVAFFAADGLYPLQTPVPFIVNTNNITEDLPRIRSMLSYKGENAGEALLRFMVQNYVVMREEYDIDTLDRDLNGIKSQSMESVFREVQDYIDPRNPESPITLYQRHSKRRINIVSFKHSSDKESAVEVIYEAIVESRGDTKKSMWQANISFQYTGLALDQNGEGEKVKPVKFVVTQYRTKRLQDEK